LKLNLLYKIADYVSEEPREDDDANGPDLCGTQADIDLAFQMWAWLEGIEWRHLPDTGGLLDQEEQLMTNIIAINKHVKIFKAQQEANAAGY
jgi:hypothetical protein